MLLQGNFSTRHTVQIRRTNLPVSGKLANWVKITVCKYCSTYFGLIDKKLLIVGAFAVKDVFDEKASECCAAYGVGSSLHQKPHNIKKLKPLPWTLVIPITIKIMEQKFF